MLHMNHSKRFIALFSAVVTLGACTLDPKNIGTPDSDGNESSTGAESSLDTSSSTISATVTGDTATGDTTSATETSIDAGMSCDCDIEAEDDDCGPRPCDPVFALCGPACVVSEPEPLQCVLEALRDRTPGLVNWQFDDKVNSTYTVTAARVFPDGSAWLFRRSADICQPEGFNSSGPDSVVMLKDAAYFEGCLAEPDAFLRFKCLQGAVLEERTECAPYVENCS